MDDFQVRLFVPAADVIGFPGDACFNDPAYGSAVVADIQPVPHIHSIPVDRQRFGVKRVVDDEGNEFFGELVGAVVVGAVRRQHRQTIGVVPGANQMVGSGLARGVRAVRLERVGFGEGRVFGRQRPIDFVS